MNIKEATMGEYWFNALADMSEEGTIPEEIVEFALEVLDFRTVEKGSKRTLEMVSEIIEDLPRDIRNALDDAIYAIQNNMVKSEYKNQYGPHSATSEFLSHFEQAVTY